MCVSRRLVCAVAGFCMMTPPVVAQTTQTATETADTASAVAQMTAEELQKLVAPVALYPDTVLIQLLVAATAPMDVILADRLLADTAGAVSADLKAKIKARQFDLSVEVLALAFPDLIRRMAEHVEWTELVGDAMLAQSDDVLAAVQVMRAQAIDSGTLVSSPEVTVSTSSKTTDIVVQPTNPAVVYVPQYDPAVVYSNPAGSAVASALIAYGTIAVIDEIFDDEDDWNDYWSCRGCADWESGTVIRNPDIDIDVDGDVIVGNDINIGNDLERSADGSWKPGEARAIAATSDLVRRRGTGEVSPAGFDRPATRSDELRGELEQLGGVAGTRAVPPSGAEMDALIRRTPKAAAVKAPARKAAPDAAVMRKTAASGSAPKKPKIARTAPATRTKAASLRGAAVTQRSGARRTR